MDTNWDAVDKFIQRVKPTELVGERPVGVTVGGTVVGVLQQVRFGWRPVHDARVAPAHVECSAPRVHEGAPRVQHFALTGE